MCFVKAWVESFAFPCTSLVSEFHMTGWWCMVIWQNGMVDWVGCASLVLCWGCHSLPVCGWPQPPQSWTSQLLLLTCHPPSVHSSMYDAQLGKKCSLTPWNCIFQFHPNMMRDNPCIEFCTPLLPVEILLFCLSLILTLLINVSFVLQNYSINKPGKQNK